MKRIYVIGGIILLLAISLVLAVNLVSRASQYTLGYPAPNGTAISVQAKQPQYRHGEPIEIVVIINNISKRTVQVPLTGDTDFRLALFDESGTPIPKTSWALNTEAYFGIGSPERRATVKLQPDETIPKDERQGSPLDLTRWFNIPKAGTYQLVVLRAMGSEPNNFAISNLATIHIR